MKSYVPVFIGVRVEGGVLPTVSQRAFEEIQIRVLFELVASKFYT